MQPAAHAATCALAWDEIKGMDAEGAPGDRFGAAVAISGDTAVIGAPNRDSGKGAAYVYRRVLGRGWLFEQKLTAGDGVAGDGFAQSVAVSGNTIVIGAHTATTLVGDETGAAYVFMRSGSAWFEQAKLVASDGTDYGRFGYSVAVSGQTAVIGESWANVGSVDWAGAAHVFVRSGDTWTRQRKLVSPSPAMYEGFGCSVGIWRDTVVVGADSSVVESLAAAGSAYVFTRSGTTWSTPQRLVASDSAAGAFFGNAVAIDRDWIVVGAHYADSLKGAAYVFGRGTTSGWGERAKLRATDGAAGDHFGNSVSVSGDAVAVGCVVDDNPGGVNAGAAYVFVRSGTSWPTAAKLMADDGAASDEFGASVSISGGLVLAGAPRDDNVRGIDAGAVYAYSFRCVPPLGVNRIQGANRYLTAAAASRQGFPVGAPAVVVATGENWPDALGGSALAGTASGPLLLTRKASLPGEVTAEVKRLGTTKAYVLGSTDAVSRDVEDALVALLGRANVVRLGGANRYETARLVADETIRLLGPAAFQELAFVATGSNYPDATAASPFAARWGVPILLANVRTGAVSLPPVVRGVYVLGSAAAVPESIYESLEDRLGAAHVWRIGGANRYATAAEVAQRSVGAGMAWNGVGLATGENFPDALAAGPMLATNNSVLLLTRPTSLPGESAAKLTANAPSIASMFIFGDTSAVSTTVESAAEVAAGL
jgi:putative cell wall-binding protein